MNPNARVQEDARTPQQLLDTIEEKGRDVARALGALRSLLDKARPA